MDRLTSYFYSPPPVPSLGIIDRIPGARTAVVDALDLCYADGFKDGVIAGAAIGLVVFVVFLIVRNWDKAIVKIRIPPMG